MDGCVQFLLYICVCVCAIYQSYTRARPDRSCLLWRWQTHSARTSWTWQIERSNCDGVATYLRYIQCYAVKQRPKRLETLSYSHKMFRANHNKLRHINIWYYYSRYKSSLHSFETFLPRAPVSMQHIFLCLFQFACLACGAWGVNEQLGVWQV